MNYSTKTLCLAYPSTIYVKLRVKKENDIFSTLNNMLKYSFNILEGKCWNDCAMMNYPRFHIIKLTSAGTFLPLKLPHSWRMMIYYIYDFICKFKL